MPNGYFSLILHAHLPYVRHNEANRLEERWVYEAMTETYIPLIWVLENQPEPISWTLSFSPPLLELLSDPVIQKRYLEHLNLTQSLLKKERNRSESNQELEVIQFYEKRYNKIMDTYQKYDCQIIQAFKAFMREGKLNCITTSATHAFLPYLATNQAVIAQVRGGIAAFEKHFGEKPLGFWLPECAYSPGIDKILADTGIRYTFVDEQTIFQSKPAPNKGIDAPVYSPHGVALFPRNHAISETIWNSSVGYPGDCNYREFYRDIAYVRDLNEIIGFIHPDGIRVDTGLKYWRVTGKTEDKEWYSRKQAEMKLNEHALKFTHSICNYLHNHQQSFPPTLITAPFDAELFGHWWFEGPEFLSEIMKISIDSQVSWVTPRDFLHKHFQDIETARPSFSTWGRNGTGEVWLNDSNAWMYRHLHHCETKLVESAALLSKDSNLLKERYADQMTREWMLAASSDWAFIVDQNSASQYAKNRFQEHIERFHSLYESLQKNSCNKAEILEYENAFPFLDMKLWTYFNSPHDQYVQHMPSNEQHIGKKILMLSWEYPPMVVGGLSRHVFDLSRKLVSLGHEVYVITSFVEGYPEHELNNGVQVYRVIGKQPQFESFFHWAGSLNVAMAEQAMEIAKKINFDCIHAHDWLVSVAALALKKELDLPLISTIHATEHGRNNGITTPLQYEINQKEWELMDGSDKLIVCSSYMKNELMEVFCIPESKLHVLPNGIDTVQLDSHSNDPVYKERTDKRNLLIFSVGRLVREKGFQTIIEAADQLKKRGAAVQFVIAGKGPFYGELSALIREKQVEDYVNLVGFVSDEERNNWFREADAALFPSHYEPFGIVALEGMAAGKLTIVSDTGGLKEIIEHEKTGLKIYPNDSNSIVWAVEYMTNHPERCTQIAHSGAETAKKIYNWDTIANQTVELYDLIQNDKKIIGEVL
jgi:1,4-alpha-glucan branching enzyme